MSVRWGKVVNNLSAVDQAASDGFDSVQLTVGLLMNLSEPAISSLEDIDKIQIPKIDIDFETTEKTLSLARSILGDELEVMLRGMNWHRML